MNEFTLLRIYKDLHKSNAKDREVRILAKELADRTSPFITLSNYPDSKSFLLNSVESLRLDKAQFNRMFPNADHHYFCKSIDEFLSEEEQEEDETFADFSNVENGEVIILSKAQVGMTTKEDIADALDEYSRLFKAGFATPAEILTLARAFPENLKYQNAAIEVLEKGEPLVVGGPASVELVDREGHLITMDGMRKAFNKYMGNIRTRNAMVLHSDVQVGWALPAYIGKSGQIFKSGVDDKHLYFITEMRDDTKIGERVIDQIKEGRIRSYSIAGSALATEKIDNNGEPATKVNELELAEVTVCEKGVNQGAHFDLLKAHGKKPDKSCVDGSCLIPNPLEKMEKTEMGCCDEKKNMQKRYDESEVVEGMEEEMEHRELTGGDPTDTAQIVEDHLEEDPDYYDKLGRAFEKFAKIIRKENKGTFKGITKKNTLEGILDDLAGQDKRMKELREKYGMPKEVVGEDARKLNKNPKSRGTLQRGTMVTTAGEDDQTFPMEK